MIQPHEQTGRPKAMSEKNLINFPEERTKHIHKIHEKRLQAIRKSFEAALPQKPAPSTKSSKKKKKKSR